MPTKKTLLTSLSTWLFKRPVIFSVFFFFISLGITALFAAFKTWLNIETTSPYIFMLLFAFVISAYYLIIKKLPNTDMSRNDLIAISNGHSLIAIIIPLFMLAFIGTDPAIFQKKAMMLYFFHPVIFMILGCLAIFLILYVTGVAISCLYAKYKRARTLGISAWKIICSMPFTFLLMWTPGYLIADKKVQDNLEIKSKWYTDFNNWVVSNKNNVLFIFLLLLLLRNTYSGLPVLILTASLLIIYALWNLKHKKDLIKNINQGYALSAVLINITIIIMLTIFA